MLVLTRKSGEVIRIGEDVVVRILEVRGHQVRIGIEAPVSVRIYREEIYRAIQSENRQAAVSRPATLEEAAALVERGERPPER